MNTIKKMTLLDRFQAAIRVLMGKPRIIDKLYFGLELKECRKCEYRKSCVDKKED